MKMRRTTLSLLAVLLRHLALVIIKAVRALRAGRYPGSYPERSVGEASPIRSCRPSIGLHSVGMAKATLAPPVAAEQAYHRCGRASAVRHASHVIALAACRSRSRIAALQLVMPWDRHDTRNVHDVVRIEVKE